MRHGFGARAGADVNVSGQHAATYEFATEQEALAFQELLDDAARRKLLNEALVQNVPLVRDGMQWAFDHVVPDPLAGYTPRFETDQLWAGFKGKADVAAYLQGGGFDVAETSVMGVRHDESAGRRTFYLRHGGQAWGGLASLGGFGPNAAGIANGDAQLALTLTDVGEPVELSVTLT